jgi:hypothetical protein
MVQGSAGTQSASEALDERGVLGERFQVPQMLRSRWPEVVRVLYVWERESVRVQECESVGKM